MFQPGPVDPSMVSMQQVASAQYQPQAVVTAQPGTQVMVVPGTVVTQPVNVNPGVREWSSGLCSCFDDIGSCKFLFPSSSSSPLHSPSPSQPVNINPMV